MKEIVANLELPASGAPSDDLELGVLRWASSREIRSRPSPSHRVFLSETKAEETWEAGQADPIPHRRPPVRPRQHSGWRRQEAESQRQQAELGWAQENTHLSSQRWGGKVGTRYSQHQRWPKGVRDEANLSLVLEPLQWGASAPHLCHVSLPAPGAPWAMPPLLPPCRFPVLISV